MNFFIFLICQTVLLLSIKSYHVHFYMICDDFCISVTSGGVTTYFSSAATSIKRDLSLDINLSNEVSIVIQNYDGRFGISGKIDYYYFFVSTNVTQIALCFTFNVLLYFNSMISERFYNGRITLLHFIKKTLFSSLIGYIFIKTLRYFHFYPVRFNSVLSDTINNKDISHFLRILLAKLRINLYIYFTFTMLLTLIFWYYLTFFCIVYYHTQVSWVIHSGVSMLSLLVLSVLYSILFAILRTIGIKYKFHLVFNMSLLLKDIY